MKIVLDTARDLRHTLPMPSATDLTPATIESWTARLTEEARDLDLTDADDRATFRGRIATATALVKCHAIGALARHFGH